MKMICLLYLAILVAVPASAQNLLDVRFKATITDTGSWSGWSKWHPDETYGGSESRTYFVVVQDTISFSDDSISGPLASGVYPPNIACSVDRRTSMLRHVVISGLTSLGATDGETHHYTLRADSLPLTKVSDDLLKITDGTWTLETTSSYSWTHPGGPEGSFGDLTQSSGAGSSAGPVDVTFPYSESSVRLAEQSDEFIIIQEAGRRLRVVGAASDPNTSVTIVNDLGKTVYRGTLADGIVTLPALARGPYFARVGNATAKFILIQ